MNITKLKKAGTVLDRINNVLATISGIFVLYMMLSVTYEVIMRYVFNRPTSWVVDIASLTIIYFTFLSTAWLLREDGHVYMDLFIMMLKPKAQSLLNITNSLLGAFVCVVLCWYGAKVTIEHMQEAVYTWGALSLPSALSLFLIPIGFFLLSIQFLIKAYNSRLIEHSDSQVTKLAEEPESDLLT